ncbi:unnamed protein product [Acanthoscelides obtectus]|uniref:Uncharacterized protein n=1 Tax=Acanthoscelides obtectus TaxID=200917 RepID=A0A9P0LGZ4_ACAOB|nr:unnamed protein product [Acanthoscelides obtectus]CAK1655720.1 Transducer of Cdc42-dependent actin assembly protein 1 homolog [Acanthoscelides obtectus]
MNFLNKLSEVCMAIKNAAISDGKEDLSELPPNQRRKKLIQKVEELQTKVAQETAARDGLMKMKGVYEANPALGDPRTIESQLNECSHRLDKLHQELSRYQSFLEECVRSIQPSSGGGDNNSPQLLANGGAGGQRRRTGVAGGVRRGSVGSEERESLSRSASDSSVQNGRNDVGSGTGTNGGGAGGKSAPGTPQLNHGCSNSPESGLGASHTSLHHADSDPDQYDGRDDMQEGEYYEAELLPVIGTCRALYPFEATSEGSIPMAQDEELHLIELDQGDGWTRVRRNTGDCEEGFVPTSYIECVLLDT